MDDALNDSLGPVTGAGTSGDDANLVNVNTIVEFTGFSNESVIHALEELGRCMAELCKVGKLANKAFLDMHPFLLSIQIDPDFMPRKLKKAYWKLFENRPLTWREKHKLIVWCRNGNITLDKLSGTQATA